MKNRVLSVLFIFASLLGSNQVLAQQGPLRCKEGQFLDLSDYRHPTCVTVSEIEEVKNPFGLNICRQFELKQKLTGVKGGSCIRNDCSLKNQVVTRILEGGGFEFDLVLRVPRSQTECEYYYHISISDFPTPRP